MNKASLGEPGDETFLLGIFGLKFFLNFRSVPGRLELKVLVSEPEVETPFSWVVKRGNNQKELK